MLGIRHIALRVVDLSRSVEFYASTLGMRLVWKPDDASAYLSSGADILALHQSDGSLDAERMGALDHFGFLVARAGDVDDWADRLRSMAIELVQNPKTHRDGSRSIYFRDPDANLIQLLYHPFIG